MSIKELKQLLSSTSQLNFSTKTATTMKVYFILSILALVALATFVRAEDGNQINMPSVKTEEVAVQTAAHNYRWGGHYKHGYKNHRRHHGRKYYGGYKRRHHGRKYYGGYKRRHHGRKYYGGRKHHYYGRKQYRHRYHD